jgi:Response regulators consisting of a CheY-like receiver domain and a winged-helix DNA-binding domain
MDHEKPKKLMVVDDDARIRDLLRRYLSQEGYEVFVAEDSKAMSRIMVKERFDLIVLDLMLPVKTACPSASVCAPPKTRPRSSC